MAVKIDGFLKVPDIKGPSVRDGHEDEIEIHGVDYKIVAPYDPNSLSRRGRVSLARWPGRSRSWWGEIPPCLPRRARSWV